MVSHGKDLGIFRHFLEKDLGIFRHFPEKDLGIFRHLSTLLQLMAVRATFLCGCSLDFTMPLQNE